jgi:F-type H+-transporting ATPase subunit c
MKMKNLVTFAKKATFAVTTLAAAMIPVAHAVAEEAAAATGGSNLGPIGAGLAIGLAVMGQGKAVGAMLESFGRNPSVGGKLLAPMLIGMALIESLVILAFVVALQASAS